MDFLKLYRQRIIEAVGFVIFIATLMFTALTTDILTFKLFGLNIQ